MTITYQLSKQDFLDYHLFSVSQSSAIQKKKRNSWMLLTLGSLAMALFFYFRDQVIMSIYFACVSVLTGIFYPRFFKWRYKKHYSTFIEENFSSRFDRPAEIKITRDTLFSKDSSSEAQVNIDEIDHVSETPYLFFITIKSTYSLIIPKNNLESIEGFKSTITSLNIPIHDHLQWKW